MNDQSKVKNIMAFLCILFGENKEALKAIFDFSPKYLIEKYERYIESDKSESEWGLHPNLRTYVFDEYCSKWNLL